MNPVAPIPDPSGHTPPPYNPIPDPIYQARQDAEHLNLLSIFYYVAAGLMGLGGLMFLLHIFMGVMVLTNFGSATAPKNPPPPGFGLLFIGMGTFALVASETLAFFAFLAGKSIARRERKTLIQVVAGFLCLNMPLGTALGVFTFIVLSRPSVAALFDAPRSS